jgi:hypothetical protein
MYHLFTYKKPSHLIFASSHLASRPPLEDIAPEHPLQIDTKSPIGFFQMQYAVPVCLSK